MKVEFDSKTFEVGEGLSIADAAALAGIKIPRLCNQKGVGHRAGCMVCAVYDAGLKSFVPSCATQVREGASYECSTQRVLDFRKRALELLLTEHKGDCLAPCAKACPYGFDIPKFLELVTAKNFAAIDEMLSLAPPCETCKALCEKVCRKNLLGSPVKIKEQILKYKKPGAKILEKVKKAPRYTHNFGRPTKEELELLSKTTNDANGCLQCHCKKADSCILRELATEMGLSQPKQVVSRKFDRARANGVVFESGKCVLCSSCVELGGLAMRGRAMSASPDKPNGLSWKESLLKAHIKVCPTGALAEDLTWSDGDG